MYDSSQQKTWTLLFGTHLTSLFVMKTYDNNMKNRSHRFRHGLTRKNADPWGKMFMAYFVNYIASTTETMNARKCRI